MNILIIHRVYGELNSVMHNHIPVNDAAGDAELILDSMGEGETFAPVIVTNFPRVRPRVTVPAETRTAKVG